MNCACGAAIRGIAYIDDKGRPLCGECSQRARRFYIWGRLPEELPLLPFRHMTHRSKHMPKNRAYLAAKAEVGKHILAELSERAPSDEIKERARARLLGAGKVKAVFPWTVRIGLVCWFPVKPGTNKIGNVGDWTNYYKALEDGLQVAGVLANDAPDFARGPAPVGAYASGIFPGSPNLNGPVFAWSISAPVYGAVLMLKE